MHVYWYTVKAPFNTSNIYMLYYNVTHLYINWEPHYFSQCMFGRTFYAKKSLFIYDMYVHTAYESNSNSNSKKGNCSEGGGGGGEV